MSIRYPGGEGPSAPDPNDPGYTDLTPLERDEVYDDMLFSDLDPSMWNTLEMAVQEVRAAIEHDRAAAAFLHLALASRMRAQAAALRRRIEAAPEVFTRKNLERFASDLELRARRHEVAMHNLQRAGRDVKPVRGWFFNGEE